MRVAVLKPDSTTVEVVEAPNDTGERLDWMHAVVGVEEIDFTTLARFGRDFPRVHMVSDDLALLREERPPYNEIASRVYNGSYSSPVAPWPIHGVVILTAFDETGETVDLPFTALDALAVLGFTVEARP